MIENKHVGTSGTHRDESTMLRLDGLAHRIRFDMWRRRSTRRLAKFMDAGARAPSLRPLLGRDKLNRNTFVFQVSLEEDSTDGGNRFAARQSGYRL